MKRLLLLFLSGLVASAVTGCGTAVKVQESGNVNFEARDGKTQLAPVLLVYKLFTQESHEIFFWDQDHDRFNIKVAGDVDPSKGVLVYLPANRRYALSGFLFVHASGRQSYDFGTLLKTFLVKPGVVTSIPYFEIGKSDQDGHFGLRKSDSHQQGPYLTEALSTFHVANPVQTADAL